MVVAYMHVTTAWYTLGPMFLTWLSLHGQSRSMHTNSVSFGNAAPHFLLLNKVACPAMTRVFQCNTSSYVPAIPRWTSTSKMRMRSSKCKPSQTLLPRSALALPLLSNPCLDLPSCSSTNKPFSWNVRRNSHSALYSSKSSCRAKHMLDRCIEQGVIMYEIAPRSLARWMRSTNPLKYLAISHLPCLWQDLVILSVANQRIMDVIDLFVLVIGCRSHPQRQERGAGISHALPAKPVDPLNVSTHCGKQPAVPSILDLPSICCELNTSSCLPRRLLKARQPRPDLQLSTVQISKGSYDCLCNLKG